MIKSPLQICNVHEDQEKFLQSQQYWEVIDFSKKKNPYIWNAMDIDYLLMFPSVAARKRFVQQYALGGKMYNKQSFMFRFSSLWIDEETKKRVPLIAMKRIENKE